MVLHHMCITSVNSFGPVSSSAQSSLPYGLQPAPWQRTRGLCRLRACSARANSIPSYHIPQLVQKPERRMASVVGGLPAEAEEARREQQINAKAQSRREENEKEPVLACRGMGILPMIPTGVQCCHLCNAAPPWRGGSPEGVSPSAGAGCPPGERGTRCRRYVCLSACSAHSGVPRSAACN